MGVLIKVRGGLQTNLPVLSLRELGVTLDVGTEKLYLGTDSGNVLIGAKGILTSDNFVAGTNYQAPLTNPITGTGTANYLPKMTGASTVGNSQIYDNGTNVGIGTTSPATKLDVAGNININTNGTNALFSTYKGANSDGNNLFIGGGGQSSIGEVGATYKGSYNTANGFQSLQSNTTGAFNTANGFQSLYSNTTGYQNTANGFYSLYSNTTGYNNTANGVYSLVSNTTGNANTANGVYSLQSNTTGYNNTANGVYSLLSNTTGDSNTANGLQSLYYNTTGSSNTANGVYSLYYNTTGDSNTANGLQSLFYNTTGSSNTANGLQAGYNPDNDIAQYRITDDTYITLIGRGATKDNASTLTNSTALGSGAHVTKSNQVVLGNASTTEVYTTGEIVGASYKVGANQIFTAPFTSGTAGALNYIPIGQGATSAPVWSNPIGSIFPSDPGADKFLKWDDSESVLVWADGDGLGDMLLASIQSVTGLKTFDTTKLAIKGSSTGITDIASANDSATNYTATLQKATGIIAYLTDITGTNSGTNTGDNAVNTNYSSLVSFPGFGTSHSTAAYGDHNHTGVYDVAGAAAAITPTTLGLVIGTDVLAQRTFGTAANSATTDFAAALGGDDNYVTDAEKTIIGNTSGSNSGDNATNTQYSSLVSNVSTNLSIGTKTGTTVDINSSDGNNVTIPAATTDYAGLMTATQYDKLDGITSIEQINFNVSLQNSTIYLDNYAWYGYTVNSVNLYTESGATTITMKISGTAITGMTSIEGDSTPTTFNATAANVVSVGSSLYFDVTAGATTEYLYGSIKITRT